MYISDKYTHAHTHIHTYIYIYEIHALVIKSFVDTSIVYMYNLVSHDSGVIFIDV